MTISQLREYIYETLSQAGIKEYQSECRLILEHIGISNTRAMIYADAQVGDKQEVAVAIAKERATTRRPIQHLLGEAWFYGRPFFVDERCLIPRFDTEVLCREAIELILKMHEPKVADICTGSGCIAITVSLETGVKVDATDISSDALDVARQNAKTHGANVDFWQGDLLEPLAKDAQYDIILSNPPYIDLVERGELEPEVTEYEPATALFAEDEGLVFYKRLANEVDPYLKDGGYLAVEIGNTQGEQVRSIFERAGFTGVSVIRDYGDNDRVVIGQRNR